METNAKIKCLDIPSLEIIKYPDPRLGEVCTAVDEVDDSVVALVERMFEIMFEGHGVGLAGPQVGVTVRLFVASPTFDPEDRFVAINPEIIAREGTAEVEEGCLSLPGVFCRVKRSRKVTIRATGLDGEVFEATADGLAGCIFQHEGDHLEGVLLTDRMSVVSRMTNRRTLKDLERRYDDGRA